MRLTLRTLLAYMDEILEPSDQQELAQKIESSEFATDLIHRTRDTMRRLRLSAPQPLGSGLGLDPNTVAEYLDNTLTPDNVADLERICLESDVHLAEVASCHHILTMVLGEPAEIDPKARQRMYTIADELESRKLLRADAAHSTDAAVAAGALGEAPGEVTSETPSAVASSTIVEVPDYLRASRWSPLGIGAGVAAVAVGIAVLVFVGRGLWGGASDQDVLALSDQRAAVDSAPPQEDLAPADAAPVDAAAGEVGVAPAQEDVVNGAAAPVQPAEGTAATPTPETGEAQPPLAVVPAAEPLESTPVETQPQTPPPVATAESAAGPPVPDAAGTGAPPIGEVAAPPAEQMAVTGDQQPIEHLSVTQEHPVPLPPAVGGVAAPAPAADATSVPPGPGLEDAPAPPPVAEATPSETAGQAQTEVPPPDTSELGTFWADRNLLLRYDAESSNWFPLATGSTIKAGDELLSLPTFRPTVALHRGIGVKLVGATSIQLYDYLPADRLPDSSAPQAPALVITYGRVELINSGEADNPLHVIIGPTAGTIRLGPGAVVAFDVVRRWVPGNDPLTMPSPVEAKAIAPNGNVSWIVGDQAHPVEKPGQWQIGPDLPVQPVDPGDEARWPDVESLDRLERSAAEQIRNRLMDPQYPASTALLDVANSRRREERALATRCAVYVGEFAPFVKALGDSDQRSVWELHIQTLREALALSPESAARVRRALFELRGDQAATDMFEMLCGYSLEDIGMTPEDRQVGALDRLITFLESESLDYRVLANYNLREITGKNLLPNPNADPQERARGIRRWRQRLAAGELEPLESYGW